MRGQITTQETLYSYVNLEDRIPLKHPLRIIRTLVDTSLLKLNSTFNALYAQTGRPSIPPEMLIKALLLQILYGVRSEIQLMEQMNYNLLFRWFVGLGVDTPVWTPETFSVNRDRLFTLDVTKEVFANILVEARKRGFVSNDHFSIDGTLLKAWASQKSFQRKEKKEADTDGKDFHGEHRSNDTHESTTDPDARLYRKSKGSESHLSYLGHVMMENENGLAVDGEVTQAQTSEEWSAAAAMIDRVPSPSHRITVGADKGYDVNDMIDCFRELNATPHIAQRQDGRRTKLDRRTTRHAGYRRSLHVRKRIEQIFGWIKSAAGIRQVKYRGRGRIASYFHLVLSAYNLVRIKNLICNST